MRSDVADMRSEKRDVRLRHSLFGIHHSTFDIEKLKDLKIEKLINGSSFFEGLTNK